MAIRRHGAGFQVDVTVRGKRAPRVSADTPAKAKAWEARIRDNLQAGRSPLDGIEKVSTKAFQTGLDSMGQLFEHTYQHHWKGTKAERSSEINGRLWVEALGQAFAVAKVTTNEIARVCDGWADRGNSAGTINRKLAALRKMLGIAHHEGVIARVPILPKRKEYSGRIRFYSDKEEASMLSFFAEDDADMHDLLVLGFDTGFRQAELLGVEVRDYTSKTNLLHLWKSKSDSPRAVPMTARARNVIVRRAKGKPASHRLFEGARLDARRISYKMERWRYAAGLRDDREAVFHATRHTCCSRLVQGGVHPFVVQKWMGHRTIETTLRYAHLAPNAFDDAVAVLDGLRAE